MERTLGKILSICIAAAMLLLLHSPVNAATIGDATAIEQGKFGVALDLDMAKRDIEGEDDDGDGVELERNTYSVKGTYGITEKIGVFAKLGMSTLEVEGFEGDSEFSYGVGLNAVIYDTGELKFGLCLQANSFSGTEENKQSEDAFDEEITWTEEVELKAMEYDLAFTAGYQIQENLSVYGGLMYSKFDGEITSDATGLSEAEEAIIEELIEDGWIDEEDLEEMEGSFDVEESDSIGIIIGGNYNITPQINIGLEGRFITETSISFLLGFLF